MFTLYSHRLIFLPLRRDHLALTLQWRNYSRDAFIDSRPITEAEHAEWFEKYLQRQRDNIADMIWIGTATGTPVCQISLYNFDHGTRSAELGRMVTSPIQRRAGYAREAVLAMQRLAAGMGRSLVLQVKERNEPARDLYESTGFTTTLIAARRVLMRWGEPA